MNRNTYPSPWQQNENISILFSSKQLALLPLAVNACEQAFGRAGELGKGESEKAYRQNLWDRRSTAPAVHQILMQAPIGENTDC